MQYRVWHENSDLLIESGKDEAVQTLVAARKNCPCESDEDWPPDCGVLHPHGLHIQIIDDDGNDVTGDPAHAVEVS